MVVRESLARYSPCPIGGRFLSTRPTEGIVGDCEQIDRAWRPLINLLTSAAPHIEPWIRRETLVPPIALEPLYLARLFAVGRGCPRGQRGRSRRAVLMPDSEVVPCSSEREANIAAPASPGSLALGGISSRPCRRPSRSSSPTRSTRGSRRRTPSPRGSARLPPTALEHGDRQAPQHQSPGRVRRQRERPARADPATRPGSSTPGVAELVRRLLRRLKEERIR